jgi:hypothetical protein
MALNKDTIGYLAVFKEQKECLLCTHSPGLSPVINKMA